MALSATNLLPDERTGAATRQYWFRLATLACYVALALVALNALLLAPTYFLTTQQIAARESELTTLEAAAAASGVSTFAAQLGTYRQRAELLVALGAARPYVPVLSAILAIAHPGVSLTGFSFSTGGKVALDGVADTRDDLRAYDLALSGAPFAASVNLPVSAYAAERDLSFEMMLTLVSP